MWVLASCLFQGTDWFHPGYLIYWHRVVHTILRLFTVCEICTDVSFLILVICVLPLSLLAWLETYDFFDLFKEPASGFTDFLYWFPFFNLIDFCSNFCYFFSSANFGFNLPFFRFPETEAYIIDFKSSSFLIYAFNAIHFLLSMAFAGFHKIW